MNRTLSFALATILASTQAGCFLFSWDPGPPPPRQSPPPYTPPSASATPTPRRTVGQPTISSVDLPEWPPIGPNGTVGVQCTSPNGQGTLTASFAKEPSARVTTSSCHASFKGSDLGEGYGRLMLRLEDEQNAGARQEVDHLLVDLSPPGVSLESSLLRPDGEIALHVWDSWVLGSVELNVDGVSSTHAFPNAYPATLGEAYDQSRVTLPLSGVSSGAHKAIVVVRDAAGNASSTTFDVVLDGTPPTISFSEPSANATVARQFDVGFSSSDDSQSATSVDLYVGGSYAGTYAGPSGRITVDATGYSAGALALELVAVDEAGNRTVATRSVTLP